MKQFNKEFMTQHLLVLCAMLIIGALVRNAAIKYGIDIFSCNLVFVVSTTVLMIIYLHISDGINRWFVPLLDKHIFYTLVANTKEHRLSSFVAVDTEEIEGEEINLEDVTFVYAEETSPTYSDYELLRQETLEAKAKKEKNILESAINYTRRTFAAYMKEEHLNQLLRVYHSFS